MRADNFVALTSLCAFVAISLFGCSSKETKYFLTEYSFLSSWLQAIGSLAAVWATYSIYRLSSRENEARERKKEEKLEIATEEAKKAAADRHALMAKVEFLSDEKLKDLLNSLYFFVNTHNMTMLNCCTNPIDKVSSSFYSYLGHLKKTIQPLNKEMLTKLANIHGEDAIELQRTLIKLFGNVSTIEDLLFGFGQSKTYNDLSYGGTSEEELVNSYNTSFQGILKEFEDNILILKKKFEIVSMYAKIN